MLRGDSETDERKGVRYIPHAAVAVVIAYMVWVRTLPYSSAVGEDRIFFSANDPWYHIRTVEYLVDNYPAVFPFDAWTHFPYGSTASTGFGGLFNQIIATVAIIIGLGDPSTRQVELVTAFAPVAFGALTAIPVYLIARRLTDRWFALIAPVTLALVTGQFLNRTTFGNAQHQSAEAFFLAFAVLGFIIAVKAAYDEKPTFAHFKDRDWDGLRTPMVASLLGALALAAYIMTWPAGIYLVATFGVFVVVQMVRDHLNDNSTEYLAISSAVVFGVAAVPVLLYTVLMGMQFHVSGTSFSILQPFTMFGTAAGILVIHALGDYLRSEEYDKLAFPAAVGGITFFGVIVLFLTGYIVLFESLVERMFSFGLLTGEGALTVAEIQPAGLFDAVRDHGTLIVLTFAGLAFLLERVVRYNRPAELALAFWSVNMFTAYFTQQRFGYYFALAVAVLSAYAVFRIAKVANFEETFEAESLKEVKGYQAITLAMVVFLFLPVVIFPVGAMGPAWMLVSAGGDEPWQEDSLTWMEENTPEIPMEYNEAHPVPPEEDFDYPEDAYGVMSWWDYGHWITHVGERIPNANPFQEGNRMAADYFTSQSEERADLIADALPGLEPDPTTHTMSDDELRSVVEGLDEQQQSEETRYVMIDDQMAAGKFGAIATWVEFGQFTEERAFSTDPEDEANTSISLPAVGERYENTVLSRLYHDDADEMEGYRLVHETETYSVMGNIYNAQTESLPQFNALLNRDRYDSDGGFGVPLTQLGDVTEGQMIQAGGGAFVYDIRTAASVKTYERVEGATLTGQANVTDGNTTDVTATATMVTDNTERPFTYTQETETDADGNFEVTVPYPTEQDVSVEDGGTDAAVNSEGSYEVIAGNVSTIELFGQSQIIGGDEVGEVDVLESDVYDGNEIQVELEEVEEPDENETADDEIIEDIDEDIEGDEPDDEVVEDETGVEDEPLP